MPRISKRLEALERAADREIFDNAAPFAMAVAYYLGDAKDELDWDAYGRVLGYQDPHEFWQALANEVLANLAPLPSDMVDKSLDFRARVRRAESKLLAKFGYDLRRVNPAALRDAPYRIVRTLPEKWLVMIKSAYRESYEAQATLNQMIHKVDTKEEKKEELAE